MLGPLEVYDGERRLALGGTKQRSVLAILLLHLGETVSSDRLIDELWGEHPPVDAQTALQQHVSRLRKALGSNGVLVTRAPGYALEAPAEQLDLARFRALVEQGRSELDDTPWAAARTLRKALEQWRGPPLADLASEPFVGPSAHALEEERLAALESRIDADLACGRHAELVGELTSLVREHPLREHLRAQLMLALYRSGRQADALDAYTDARRALVDELALEPGPELQRLQQAILAHDAELAAPERPGLVRRRPHLLVGAALAVAVVLAAVGVAMATRGQGSAEPSPAAAPGTGIVLALDSSTGRVRRRIPIGRAPSAIAAERGVVWVVDADAQTISKFPGSSRVIDYTVSTGATPLDLAVGSGSPWVVNGRRRNDVGFTGPVATGVSRLYATTGAERDEIPLRTRLGAVSNRSDNHIAVRGTGVWVVTPYYDVVRIDAATGLITGTSDAVPAEAVATGPAGVWVAGGGGRVARLDPVTAKPIVRTRVPASSVGSIAVGKDAVWVTSPDDAKLWRIDARRPAARGAIELPRGMSDVVVGPAAVWVANPFDRTVTRIDARTSKVERTVHLDAIPRSLAVDGETLWVAAAADPTARPSTDGGVRTFPLSTCAPAVPRDRPSDLLIVSDLPLQMGSRAHTLQMSQAIQFVLREHGYRAGRHRVAYQSCDDSLARTGLWDGPKCASNARAYAASADVVGVVGPYNSGCAIAAVPELNRSAAGPLVMVSPLNSIVGLTRPGVGVDDDLPEALYPTGARNYARVYPTDDLEGAALALFARRRGWNHVFVLDDGRDWQAMWADAFETAARRVGLDVLGRASWDPRARSYAPLTRRVRASGARAVYVSGLADTNTGAVVRALRARLGRGVTLLGPEGLTPVSTLFRRSHGATRGMYVAVAGVSAPARFPPAGVRWAKRFAATQHVRRVKWEAVYAAQATEVLLAAIARSDGTRASVLQEVFATRVRNGLLGSFGIDANGDVTEGPVTIARVDRGGGSDDVQSLDGATIVSIERPSPKLVAPGE